MVIFEHHYCWGTVKEQFHCWVLMMDPKAAGGGRGATVSTGATLLNVNDSNIDASSPFKGAGGGIYHDCC